MGIDGGPALDSDGLPVSDHLADLKKIQEDQLKGTIEYTMPDPDMSDVYKLTTADLSNLKGAEGLDTPPDHLTQQVGTCMKTALNDITSTKELIFMRKVGGGTPTISFIPGKTKITNPETHESTHRGMISSNGITIPFTVLYDGTRYSYQLDGIDYLFHDAEGGTQLIKIFHSMTTLQKKLSESGKFNPSSVHTDLTSFGIEFDSYVLYEVLEKHEFKVPEETMLAIASSLGNSSILSDYVGLIKKHSSTPTKTSKIPTGKKPSSSGGGAGQDLLSKPGSN